MKKDKKRRLCAAGMAWLLLLGGALLLSGCDEPPELEETPATPDGGGTGGGGGEGAGGGGGTGGGGEGAGEEEDDGGDGGGGGLGGGGGVLVITFAGSGETGYFNGIGEAAKFYEPFDVAVDGDGNVYVGDMSNYRIRKITPGGTVSTLAGSGTEGDINGIGTAAQFKSPRGVAVDSAGTVYVADSTNHRIRTITPGGEVSTLADGTGAAAQFSNPQSVAVDGAGNVYVADLSNRIRKITPGGEVTTLAGNGTAGRADGIGAAAQFNQPTGVAVDSDGNVYVADSSNHRIRKITPGGTVSTLAGSGEGVGLNNGGYADGPGTEAQFYLPLGVAVDGGGNVYVADMGNCRIRKITPCGTVSTLAGTDNKKLIYADGPGAEAKIPRPNGVAVDGAGTVYVADAYAQRILKITQ